MATYKFECYVNYQDDEVLSLVEIEPTPTITPIVVQTRKNKTLTGIINVEHTFIPSIKEQIIEFCKYSDFVCQIIKT